MKVALLNRLADLLDRDADNPKGVKFDLGDWASPAPVHGESRYWQDKDEPIKVDCGTSACALGLAAISGEFAAEGLTVHMHKVLDGPEDKYIMFPTCGEAEGFHAGANLFGISYDDARYLFDPDCYDRTPIGAEGERYVAQRIRDMIKGEFETDQHPGLRRDYNDEDDSDYYDSDY